MILFPAVYPSSVSFATDEVVSVNGSSAVGLCSDVSTSDDTTTCTTPITSVLFDDSIPTLTALDGNMWASQLLTLSIQNPAQITFNFAATPDYSGVRQVEVVMFNCPEWGITVQNIRLLIPPSSSRATISTSDPTSCESLVSVSISTDISENVFTLQFLPAPGTGWFHLAEIIFYGSTPTEMNATATNTTATNTTTSEMILTTLPLTATGTIIPAVAGTAATTHCPTISLVLTFVITAIACKRK